MFYASLLFCWMSVTGPQCLIAEDTYGPYKSVEACQRRIEEMSSHIVREIPLSQIRGSRCGRGSNGEFT